MALNINYNGQIKQNSTPVIYFNLTDFSTNADKTGVSSVTVYYSKNGGNVTELSNATITEMSSTNMPGIYKISLTTDLTDTIGQLLIIIGATDCNTIKLLYDVVGNVAKDIYDRLGTPNGSSLSADIASIKNDTTNIDTNIDTIGTEITSLESDVTSINNNVSSIKTKTDLMTFEGNWIKSAPQTAVNAAIVSQAVRDAIAETVWAQSGASIPFRTQGGD